MNVKFNKTGQSTMEYSVLIIILIGVFVAMNFYVKRGFQGKWKEAVDDYLGDQYDPYMASGHIKHAINEVTRTEIKTQEVLGELRSERRDFTTADETRTGDLIIGQQTLPVP